MENKDRIRPVSKRPKMDLSNRAKQFMPFSALKGLEEALIKIEQEMPENPADLQTSTADITKNI